MSSDQDDSPTGEYNSAYQQKLAVHERDRYMCINCRETFDDPDELHTDHIIARGKGGANTVRNLVSECLRCHEAKHDERPHAPTIRFEPTGDMIEKDFRLFVHFVHEILPALTEAAVGHRIEPSDPTDTDKYEANHIPAGDVRRLNDLLADLDGINYAPMMAHQYM